MATILLENKARIDEDLLKNIIDEVKLPSGRILLILNDGPLPTGKNRGECVPRCLLKYSGRERFFSPFEYERWDCGVAISHKACILKKDYPAYFAYIIGHELGHAHICLTDVSIHIHCCLIQDFIRKASNDRIIHWHELPHEELFDQFGIYIAESLFTHKKLNEEITQMLKVQGCKDKKRLEHMMLLSGSNTFDGIRESLVIFSKPYKNKLIELWKEDAATRGCNSLTKYIDDYDALFK